MYLVERIAGALVLLWIAVYAGSFGIWTWKRKNRLGGAVVFLLVLTMLVLPLYVIYSRG